MPEQSPPSTDVQNLVDQAMAQSAQQAVEQADDGSAGDQPTDASIGREPQAVDMPEIGDGTDGSSSARIELLSDVDLHVKIELGRTHMLLEDVLRLVEGSVVELDKLAGDPVDVYVNERLIARGEVLVLNDNFCIRISEIVDQLDEKQLEMAVGAGATDA